MLKEITNQDGETVFTFTTDYPSIDFNTSLWNFFGDSNDDKLPERYIINDGATILFWENGEKTIIKRSKNDNFDKRLAFLTAYFQHHCGLSKCKANKYIDNLVVESKKK